MIACVLTGIGFLLMLLVGVFAGPDRLVLPGFLGLVACWGLAVWLSTRSYNRAVSRFTVEQEVRDWERRVV